MSFYVDNDWWNDQKYPSLMNRRQRKQRISELESTIRTRMEDGSRVSRSFDVKDGVVTVTADQMRAFNNATSDVRKIRQELDTLISIDKNSRRNDIIVMTVGIATIVLAFVALAVI